MVLETLFTILEMKNKLLLFLCLTGLVHGQATTNLSLFPELAEEPAAEDWMYFWDTSAARAKKVRRSNAMLNSVATDSVQTGAITTPKLAPMASGKVLGRGTAGTGPVEEIVLGPDFIVSGDPPSLSLDNPYEFNVNVDDWGDGALDYRPEFKEGLLFSGPLVPTYPTLTDSDSDGLPEMDVNQAGGRYTATGNVTLEFLNSPANDQSYPILLTASGGNRTITFPSSYDLNNGVTATFVVVQSGQTIRLVFAYDQARWIVSGLPAATSGTGAYLAASGGVASDLQTNAEVYGPGWNGSNEVPTKNDIYDKVEALVLGGGSGDVTVFGTPGNNQLAVWTDADTVEGDANLTYDSGTQTLSVPNLDVGSLSTPEVIANAFTFEGTTDDAFEGTFVGDPTVDRSWNFVDADGYFMMTEGGPPGNTRIPFGNANGVFTTDSVFNYVTGTDTLNVPNVVVSTEVYDQAGWNGDMSVPTKDAIRDKIETLGGGSAPTFASYRDKPPTTWEEFLNAPQGSGPSGNFMFIRTTTGTGSSLTQGSVNSSLQAHGVVDMYTGSQTSPNGLVSILAGGTGAAGAGINFANATHRLEWRIQIPDLIAAASEEYTVRIGFIDDNDGDSTDGVYFQYDATSANWRTRCVLSGVDTGTFDTSSTAVTVDAWITLTVVVNSTTAEFYVNDVLINTETANIPVTTARATSIGASILKTVGTTGRDLYLDYVGYDVDYVTTR